MEGKNMGFINIIEGHYNNFYSCVMLYVTYTYIMFIIHV